METTTSLIARARAYLDARRGERTTLEELGRAVGMSPFHLQRSFKRTLGLSPKDYQQALRLEDTKRALADAILDRLVHNAYKIALTGKSMRDSAKLTQTDQAK